MKGIILAGGTGSRLRPITSAVCKQLLPVYDKPMVYYPLATLMLAGIRDILLITTPDDRAVFHRLLGDGSDLGVRLAYTIQDQPRGIAQALTLGESFIGDDSCALVLGDNMIVGAGLTKALEDASQITGGAHVFGYRVEDPTAYGVLAFHEGRVVDVVEKPVLPPSRFAIPGLYFFGRGVSAMARDLTPSARGELEITDLIRRYLPDRLEVTLLGRGTAWLDMGTPASLRSAADFVAALQDRTRLLIGSPEEVAFGNGWLDAHQLRQRAAAHAGTRYGELLAERANEGS